MNQPTVIALNGPPHSGKTWIGALLQQLIPDAVRLQPSTELYLMMQEEGLAPRDISYHAYKLLPDSRRKLIEGSGILRSRDYNVFERRVTSSKAYQSARVVIIDNVGHTESEFAWYDRHSLLSLLIRLDTPYNELEPVKAASRRLKANWESDSRSPAMHHTMLTAYDSRQMTLLLNWLSGPLTQKEAGPYYGIKCIWDSHIRPNQHAASHDAHSRSSGQLAGLG